MIAFSKYSKRGPISLILCESSQMSGLRTLSREKESSLHWVRVLMLSKDRSCWLQKVIKDSDRDLRFLSISSLRTDAKEMLNALGSIFTLIFCRDNFLRKIRWVKVSAASLVKYRSTIVSSWIWVSSPSYLLSLSILSADMLHSSM